MNRFGAIRTRQTPPGPPSDSASPPAEGVGNGKTGARAGKKVVSGHFSAEMSRSLHLLAVEQGASLQSLMGEAFDDLFRKYGKHPFGER